MAFFKFRFPGKAPEAAAEGLPAAPGESMEVLVSPQGLPDDLGRLLHPDRRLLMPDAPELQPHPAFLGWHRENVFKR